MSIRYAGASSTYALASPNTGLRCTINVVDMSSSLPSTLMLYWVSEGAASSSVTSGDPIWAQIGYYTGEGNTPQYFAEVFNLTTTTLLVSFAGPVTTGSHTFTMSLVGTTIWGFYVDGTEVGSFNMGVSTMGAFTGYPLYAVSEQQGALATIPSVEFTTAMSTLHSGVWYPVQNAICYLLTSPSAGVEGQIQDGALSGNQILVGSGLSSPASNGGNLWTATNINVSGSVGNTVHGIASSSISGFIIGDGTLFF